MTQHSNQLVERKNLVESKIALLDDNRFPLLAIFTGERGKDYRTGQSAPLKKKSTPSAEFKWYEDNYISRTAQVTGTSQTIDPATGGNITLSTGQGALFKVNDVIHVVDQKWNFQVTAVAGDTITVGKELSGATGSADVANNEIFIIGNAFEEGAGLASERYTVKAEKSNYTQIFKTTYGLTGTALSTKTLIEEDEMRYQRRKQLAEHAVMIEYAFLFGKKAIDLTGSNPKRYTGGILSFIQTNAAANVNSEAAFNDFLEKAFAHGSSTKYMFASPKVLSMIDSWAMNKVQIKDQTTKYGLRIREYTSTHGTLYLVRHDLLQGNRYGNYAIVLDMPNVTYRYLEGRDTTLTKDVQAPGDDQKKEQLLTEAGLELKNEETHAVMSVAAL